MDDALIEINYTHLVFLLFNRSFEEDVRYDNLLSETLWNWTQKFSLFLNVSWRSLHDITKHQNTQTHAIFESLNATMETYFFFWLECRIPIKFMALNYWGHAFWEKKWYTYMKMDDNLIISFFFLKHIFKLFPEEMRYPILKLISKVFGV